MAHDSSLWLMVAGLLAVAGPLTPRALLHERIDRAISARPNFDARAPPLASRVLYKRGNNGKLGGASW